MPDPQDRPGLTERPVPGRPPLPTGQARTKRLNIYVTPADAARFEAAWANMPYRERPTSFSAFCAQAIETLVHDVETKHNGGRSYVDEDTTA